MANGVRAVGALVLVLTAATAPAGAAGDSLPAVPSGHRPGPDVLYADAPRAPQLENTGPWRADPILISGAAAYRDGEFLYQDFLYDDHGAYGGHDPSDPMNAAEFMFSPKRGTATYPTDPAFANNGADLVELRVRRVADATAFRVTLNTLQDPERVAFTIALGSSAAPVPWPHRAGVRSPAELFLTVHGATAELRDATGAVRAPSPAVAVDLERRQFDVRVADAAWNPRGGPVRIAAGVGLWDRAAGAYLVPAPGSASATRPGGGAGSGAALFNLAFRFEEPVPKISEPGVANTTVEGGIGTQLDAAWWRERAQADALATGDVSAFAATVDFGKLAAAADEDFAVPKTGPMNRILASHTAAGQGIDHSRGCFPEPPGFCVPRFLGQLQPYTVYVPQKPRPEAGHGLAILLHGLSANHNEFLGSRHASQLGERGLGSIVVAPYGRGPDGFYRGLAEADVFEVWADIARRYELDPARTVLSGYSMGGIGTFRLATRWPDLFARVFPVVGFASGAEERLAALRNVPVMLWNAAQDELVNVAFAESTRVALTEAGVRYDQWLFNPAGHITLGNNDEYGPAAEFLGDHRVDANPARVSYVVQPGDDLAEAGVVADHAYWLSAVRQRDPAARDTGAIDVRSHAFGRGDPPVSAVQSRSGVLEGGSHGPLPYLSRRQEWGEAPAAPRANRLDVRATNVGFVAVDVRRAGVDCATDVRVESDGPIVVDLAGCARAETRGCLPRRSTVGERGIGRVRIGRTRAQLARLSVRPIRRGSRTWRYCVSGSRARVTAVFSSRSRRGRVRLLTSTARAHRVRRVGAGASSRRMTRALRHRRRVAPGLYRASPRSRRVVGTRRGKVRFVGVADRRVARSRGALVRYVRLARP